MQNKIGSVVAIEPSSGEILALISSPGIDIKKLSQINKYYSEIINDPLKPMFNRAIMSPQPPGSVFKLVNALIGLQEGTLTEGMKYYCNDGYRVKGLTVGCHDHKSPLNLEESIMMSCNAYYCHVFKNIIENPKYSNQSEAINKWKEYVESFGLGTNLHTDFPHERRGSIPSSKLYNKIYGENRWNATSIISLSIGQGELGTTPLQLANLGAIIANRGFYHTPHIIKSYGGADIDKRFKKKNYVPIEEKYFGPVIEGMERVVNSKPGIGATATIAKIPGIILCGKTGTAENPHGDTHAIFLSFAPKENPEIAIAVYIENAGFGGTWAAPIASLMTEKYLKDSISPSRKWLENRIINANLINKTK